MRPNHLCLGVAVGLLLGLSARTVVAQRCIEAREGVGRVPLPGTAGYNVAYGAFDKVAQTYGAANMLEKRILPLLRLQGSEFVFAWEDTGILSVTHIPVCGELPTDPMNMGAVDLGSGGVGGGYKIGPLALFYSGSSSYRSVRADRIFNRWALTFGLPFMASWASPIGGLFHRYDGDALTMGWDFIVGAELGNRWLTGSAGYVASNGIYANVTSPFLGIFGSAVFGTSFTSAPVATVGITNFDWLIGDLRDIVGSTSLYVRQLEYAAAPMGGLAKKDLGAATTGAYAFRTVHFEQYAIGGVVDVLASMSLAPTRDFYDASIALHGDGMVPEAQGFSRGCGAGSGGGKITVGVVKLPVLYSHGSAGGFAPRLAAELGGFTACDDKGGMIGTVGLALNAADLVSVVPFAKNAVSFTFRLAWGGGAKHE